MATLTNQERNILRKAVRLLDMRENRGQPAYDSMVDNVLGGVREMLLPTEKFKIHVPEEYAFKLKVVWYEIDVEGVKHLHVQVIEPEEELPPEVEGHAQTGAPAP